MTNHVVVCFALAMTVACTSAPSAPSISPGSLILATVHNTAVNISGVALTRAPLRIEFTGNYGWRDDDGTLMAPTDPHVLTRTDIAGVIPPINTASELETYLNTIWFPSQLRDDTGARVGFALIHIISFSPTDVQWELRISDSPIVKWW